MFYHGTKVGCCAIMYEVRKGGSKEASSKGNKQRQTGLCLPFALLNWGGRLLQKNQHTRPHARTHISFISSHHSHTANGDPVVTHTNSHLHCPKERSVGMFVYVCVLVCVRAYLNASVSVPRCRPLLSWLEKQTPVSPQAHEETGWEHSGDTGWMEGKVKRKGRERREREKKRGRLKEKD